MNEKGEPASSWDSVDPGDYDQKWHDMEAAGQGTHGEVDFVERFSPASVLDAGCGTGRVAIELARRGIEVVGVDLDEPFLTQARAKAPELDFRLGDLSTATLERTFDAVVMAGNVMIFIAPNTEAEVIANMTSHVSPGGYLISGFQLGHGLGVDDYNQAAATAGLTLAEHWSSWNCDEPTESPDYAVLVHRR